MYEHAFHIDFGANAKAYIEAFMRNVDWKAVQGRYEDASKVAPPRPLVQEEFADVPGVSPEEVKAMLDAGKPVQIIDNAAASITFPARRTSWKAHSGVIPIACRSGPESFRRSDPVVTFCVYGFHVGCQTATALRAAGLDARYMKGGHSAWKAIGGATKMYK